MILIIDNHSIHLNKLKRALEDLGAEFIVKDQRSYLDDTGDGLKGVILSGGGPNLAKYIDIDSIRADIAAVVRFDLPILGICEGHQILGEIFGGQIGELNDKRRGMNTIRTKENCRIFTGLKSSFKAWEGHMRFVKKVPPDFENKASSALNKIEAICHDKKQVYGVQFHPEASGKAGMKILENFLKLCGI